MAKNNNSNYERWAKRRTTPSLISFSTYWTPVVIKSRLLGELIAVNEMEDQHLVDCINLLRRKIAGAKLIFGKTSLSLLILQYLEAEANKRGLNHDGLG